MNVDVTSGSPDATPRDRGTTFIEILVAVVILGIGAVGTLTALQVSVRGSDTHRFRVNATSELEGAGAYLARTQFNATCSTSASDLETALGNRPGTNNSEISLSVPTVTCSGGLPVAELLAESDRNNASETLDVVLGGISVLKPEGASSPGPTCTWGTLTASPPSVNVHTSGANAGKLKANATISLTLTFTGSCTGPVVASISSPATATFFKNLTADPLSPQQLNATLATDEIFWRPATYTVDVGVVPSTTFVVG